MKKHNNSSNGAMSGSSFFTNGLQIAFIVLKLCGVIDWSWWWVFVPVWGSALIVVAVILAIGVIGICKHLWRRRREDNQEAGEV